MRYFFATLFLITSLIAVQACYGHGDEESEQPETAGSAHAAMSKSGHMDHWTAPEADANRVNPNPVTAESIARGKESYETYCTSCHGKDRRGTGPVGRALDPKPADLAMMAPMHPDGDLFWKIRTGRGAMASWKVILSESQTWDLVNYLKNSASTIDKETKDHDEGAASHRHGGHTH